MNFSQIQNQLQALASKHGAKISTGKSNWERQSTGITLDLGDNVGIVEGEWGFSLAISGVDNGEQLTIYIPFAPNESDDAKSYEIMLMIYKGDDPTKTNCFRAVAR